MVTDDNELEGDSDDEDYNELDFDDPDLNQLLQSYFTEQKKNRNIPDVLLEIKKGIDTHNKILLEFYKIFKAKKF